MFVRLFLILILVLVLGGLAAVVYGIVYAIANRRPWVAVAAVLTPLLLLAAISMFVFFDAQLLRVSHRPPVVVHSDSHSHSAARSARRHSEKVNQKIDEARRAVEERQQSIERLWNELNEPRIPLEEGEQPAAGTATSAAAHSENSSPPSGSGSSDADQGLANQAEQVARMARLAATVAGQVSDAASAIARGLVPPSEGDAEEAVGSAVADEADAAPEPVAAADPPADPPAERRPDWIDAPPKRVGNTWREVVIAGDYATVEEVYQAADRQLLLATYDHLTRLTDITVHRPDHRRIEALGEMGVTIDYVRREIAKDEFLETVERSVGPMKKLYTLVEFSPSVDRELRARWDAYRRTQRLAAVGVGAGSVLGLVALLFGLLKIDTWTKGYYTKRLFLGVPAAIMAVVLIAVLANASRFF